MSYELIISEKPQAAQKIAIALADKAPKKVRDLNVNYFALTHKGKDIRVASAVGHLYGLGEKGGESWTYPIFSTEWKPIYKNNKAASFTKDYIKLLEKLGKDADDVTLAADFDIEGEVIGLNVMRYALNRKDAFRMKFSTLTKGDLIKAYENKLPTIQWGQAKAGETRHTLDWFYGINLSRAFTQAIKKGTNQFKVLSTGRVQAPALHFLAERERKIEAFNPEDYTEIYLDANSSNVDFRAQYELPLDKIQERKSDLEEKQDEDSDEKITVDKSKIFDKDWANKVVEDTTGNDGIIKDISSKQFKQKTPIPFDLTSLQMEASTMLGFSPKRTLELAQKLYIEGVTSYPRTSSQKLPKELELDKVIDKLKRQSHFVDKINLVLKINPSLKPNEGKKEDPAHPAIHPTGEIPTKLEAQELRLYDLIVKRFFAVFGKDAIRETNTVKIDIQSHNFVLKGTRTVEKNWHDLYEPYLKFEDVELPVLEKGGIVKNKKIEDIDKKTTPPKRYTDASIIKELEKRSLGTKATRADILANLRDRGYVIDKSIKVTELGLAMDEVLAKETPMLVDEALTRHFEDEMEKIREEKLTPDKILGEAQKKLEIILGEIQSKEVELGKELAQASHMAIVQMTTVAKCPNCEDGMLMIRQAKKTKQKFIGCNGYPDCKTIFNLPSVPVIKPIPNQPEEDGKIFVFAGKSEGNMSKYCVNCEQPKESDEKKYNEEGMQCPNCSEGKMKLRKSFYGEFLGCDNYPKCKTMMQIKQGKVDTENPIVPKPKTAKKKAPAKKKETEKKTTKKVVKKKKNKV